LSEEKRKRDELKELQSIRNLLILLSRANKITSEEIGQAVGMEAGSIRAMFPKAKTKGKKENGS